MSDAHRVSVTLLLAVLCGCGSLQQRRVARDCEDGAVEACVAAAVRQETELGPADFGWTPSWFRRKACDLRHWPSCLLVGLFAEERGDYASACEVHLGGCELGATAACESAAYLHATNQCPELSSDVPDRMSPTVWSTVPTLPVTSAVAAPELVPGEVYPRTAGFLSRAQIESVVLAHSDRLRSCFERVMVAGYNAPFAGYQVEGRLTAEWTIQLDGTVTEVLIIEDSVGARLVSECVELAIGAFVFEPPNGGMVVVTYPFVFRTE